MYTLIFRDQEIDDYTGALTTTNWHTADGKRISVKRGSIIQPVFSLGCGLPLIAYLQS